MFLAKRIAAAFFALVTLVCLLNQPAQGRRSQPQEMYRRAWQLVKDNYHDPTFAGQDWSCWEHKFDQRLKTERDAYSAIQKMLASLKDPYTRFLDPKAFQDENDAIDAKIVGIGINLQQSRDQKRLLVTRTLEESPAEQAGMRSGDEIISIEGRSAVGLTPEQAAERIRGPAGTPVRISIVRNQETREMEITRQEIAIHAVKYRILENNIGYIQLSTFISNDAAREFRRALGALQSTDALIIDVRDNPGGLLSNALEIADMLLEGGTIVSTVGRNGKHTDMSSGDPLTRQAIVVLVDEDSASASEIVAGALQDNRRAIVVGQKTYGKGLVQEINKLPGGAAVHITVSKYLTPSGSDINTIGIVPDITVDNSEEQVKVAVRYIQEKVASLQPIHTTALKMVQTGIR